MLKALDMYNAISGRNNEHPKLLHRVFLSNEYDTANIMYDNTASTHVKPT